MSTKTIGGKVVITGIGKYEEDEFMLTLLNEQVCLHISLVSSYPQFHYCTIFHKINN